MTDDYAGCECCFGDAHRYDDFENGPTGAEQMDDDTERLLRQADEIRDRILERQAEAAQRRRTLEVEAQQNRKSRNMLVYVLVVNAVVLALVLFGVLPWGFAISALVLAVCALMGRAGFVREQRRARQARFDNGELV